MNIIKFKCKKLVRDNIPETAKEKNIKIEISVLQDDEEYVAALKNKLIEEANELSKANKKEDIIEELSDVFEVFSSIISAYNLTQAEIEKSAEEKKKQRGGFSKRIFATGFEIDESNPFIENYLSQPEQYTQE